MGNFGNFNLGFFWKILSLGKVFIEITGIWRLDSNRIFVRAMTRSNEQISWKTWQLMFINSLFSEFNNFNFLFLK